MKQPGLSERLAACWSTAGVMPCSASHIVSTRILGKAMRDAVRNKEVWKRAPYAYPRS